MTAVTWSQVRFAHPDGRTALEGIDLEVTEGDHVQGGVAFIGLGARERVGDW